MKSTMIMRSIANPRRTVLTQLEDAEETTGTATGPAADEGDMPIRTANPQRTVLQDSPLG